MLTHLQSFVDEQLVPLLAKPYSLLRDAADRPDMTRFLQDLAVATFLLYPLDGELTWYAQVNRHAERMMVRAQDVCSTLSDIMNRVSGVVFSGRMPTNSSSRMLVQRRWSFW